MQWQFFTRTGDAWEAMRDALSQAQHSIYLESYIFLDDDVGRAFVDILVSKAQHGVDVRLILDGLGSFWFSVQSIQRLRAAGARVVSFQSLAFRRFFKSLRRLNNRNHRKVLIVDKCVGFIGGVNVRKEYQDWLDLHLRLEGEEVLEPLIRSFGKTWIIGGGERRGIRHLLKGSVVQWRRRVQHLRYVFDHPYRRFRENSQVRREYFAACKRAKKSITIATPYFLPDKKLLSAFTVAMQRGIQLRILVPAQIDVAILHEAMGRTIQRIHELGASVYLLPTMMHGKALIMDTTYGMIGSSNIDPRSFFSNHEANITFTKPEMVKDLVVILEHWRKLATPFRPSRDFKSSIAQWMLGLIGRLLTPLL